MIFQQFNLVPRLDVLTNVLLGRLNHRSTIAQPPQHLHAARSASMAIAALERLGIEQTALQRGRHAVGRPAAARRHRPRPDAAAEDDARRRADRLARSAQRQDRDGLRCATSTSARASPSSPTCTRSTPRAPIASASSAWRPASVVFDGAPDDLTADAVAEIYGTADGAGIDEAMTSTSISTPSAAQAVRRSRRASSRLVAAGV